MESLELIRSWIKEGDRANLLSNPRPNSALLTSLQITQKSILGSLLANSAGVIIADGWIRLLGGIPHDLCPAIWDWNEIPECPLPKRQLPGALICGYDAIGGFFAINGGAFKGELGSVFYFGSDTLTWDDLEQPHSSFVQWALTGDLVKFYGKLRWNKHSDLTLLLKSNQGIHLYPPPWTNEGKNPDTVSKAIVPLTELWDANHDAAKL